MIDLNPQQPEEDPRFVNRGVLVRLLVLLTGVIREFVGSNDDDREFDTYHDTFFQLEEPDPLMNFVNNDRTDMQERTFFVSTHNALRMIRRILYEALLTITQPRNGSERQAAIEVDLDTSSDEG